MEIQQKISYPDHYGKPYADSGDLHQTEDQIWIPKLTFVQASLRHLLLATDNCFGWIIQ